MQTLERGHPTGWMKSCDLFLIEPPDSYRERRTSEITWLPVVKLQVQTWRKIWVWQPHYLRTPISHDFYPLLCRSLSRWTRASLSYHWIMGKDRVHGFWSSWWEALCFLFGIFSCSLLEKYCLVTRCSSCMWTSPWQEKLGPPPGWTCRHMRVAHGRRTCLTLAKLPEETAAPETAKLQPPERLWVRTAA